MSSFWGTFIAAADTACAGMQIGVGCVNELRMVAGFLCAADKMLRQQVGRAVPVGAALQYKDVHR